MKKIQEFNWQNDKKVEQNRDDKGKIGIEIGTDVSKWTESWQIREIKVEYNEKKKILNVWGVIVEKWMPEDLVEENLVYKDTLTYVNSNVDNYFFFASLDDWEDILNYYKTILTKQNWQLLDWTISTYSKDNKNLKIMISEIIPDNLAALSLTWSFVEFQMEEIFVEPEFIEPEFIEPEILDIELEE